MSSDGTANTPGAAEKAAQDNKPKRVRTGCLTCRERHLKCDEGLPVCHNCQKSSRQCKRGIRLDFIDTTVATPPTQLVPTTEWTIAFHDESRDIASEYKGGLGRYGRAENDAPPENNNAFYMDIPNGMPPPATTAQQQLPAIQNMRAYPEEAPNMMYEHQQPQPQQHQQHQQQHPPQNHRAPSHAPSHHHTHSQVSDSTYSGSNIQPPGSSYQTPEHSRTPPEGARDYLDTQEETLFMQVFVEEVGLWMDSMDPMKHFSRLLPFHALGEPMLLNAFLACGARHLALVNPKYKEDKALHYYDTATRYLLSSLQDPNRDTVICATTAVILNVYEIMCERALQRMNHIAGARALIKECGWNARSTGIGAACFWLNVGMELLSCLHFNWQVAWHPDEWGVDMDFTKETEYGREEIWTYRIVYIVAKVANFRASIPRTQESSPRHENMRLQNRYNEWKRLKDLADLWNDSIPRTMHPLAYLYPGQTISGSAFPEVWLIKRTSIVARLFYHTCMCLLAQINPAAGPDDPEMHDLQHRHSQFICGISAHVKDRGVASVALRSLAIAAECLTTRREQEEVLQIFDKIRQETGWRVGFVNNELKEKWGWNNPEAQQPPLEQNVAASVQNNRANHVVYQQQPLQPQVTLQPMMPAVSLPPAPPVQRPQIPVGIVNPFLAEADFSMPHHPYHEVYVAPNPAHQPLHPLIHPSAYY